VLNVKRLRELSGAAQSFRDTVVDSVALVAERGDAGSLESKKVASEVADIVLAPGGSYLQELLVEEAVRITDALARQSVKQAADSPLGQLARSTFARHREVAALLGSARPFLLPVPLPGEMAQWVSPVVSEQSTDEEVLKNSQEVWELFNELQGRDQAQQRDTNALSQLPGFVQQYAPGIQTVAEKFRVELLDIAAMRLREANRLDVSFSFSEEPKEGKIN